MASNIDTAQPFYLQSNVGTSVLPDFQGGTLRIDQVSVTDSNNYTVENFATNAIDTFGHTITFSGNFSGAGPLEITDSVGGGVVIVTGVSGISGALTIDSGATLQWGNGSAAFLNSNSATVDNGDLILKFGGGSVSTTIPISGTGNVTVQSGTFGDAAVNTYAGTTLIDSGANLVFTGGGSVANSSLFWDEGTFDISGTTAGTSIVNLMGSGSVMLGGQRLTITNASTTFSGVLSDGGNSGGTGAKLTIAGGTETLTAINTYTGATAINAGAALLLTGSGSIGQSLVVADNGTFDISGTSSGASIKDLMGSGAAKLGAMNLDVLSASGLFSGVLADGGSSGGVGGSLTVSGGTLTLTGHNTFTGDTLIAGGAVLELANGGSVAGGIDNNGTVRFSNSGTVTVANTFVGAGTVEIAAGTVVATGSSVPGAVLIDPGATLRWGNGSLGYLIGSSVMADNGTLVVDFGSDNLTTTLPISGSGGLTIQSGTFTENGNNNYTGSTIIKAGAHFLLTNSATIAASSGVADAGTFDISGTSPGVSIAALTGAGQANLGAESLTITNGAGTFSGVLADGGASGGTAASLIVAGGKQILTGTNTFTGGTTVNSGATLQLGSGGTTGTVAGSIFDAGLLRFAYSGAVTFGALSGSGSVEVVSGTAIATANDAVSGKVTIDSGATLQWGNGGLAYLFGNLNHVIDNGTLAVDFGGSGLGGAFPISGSGRVVILSGSLNNAGVSTYTGNTTINSGGSLLLSNTGSIANSALVSLSGLFDISETYAGASIARLTGSGQVNLGAQTLTITGASGTFSGSMFDGGFGGGTGGGLTIAGGTQILTGGNVFTGTTTIGTGATLQLGNGGTAGSVAGLIALATGANLKVDHTSASSLHLTMAGSDIVTGGAGAETFDVGATLAASDQINGAGGADIVKLGGDYSTGLTLTATTMLSVETLQLGAGYDYKLTTNNATVASGQTLTVDGAALGASDTLTFNGAAETNGAFVITSGAGNDALTGGAGNDLLTGNDGMDSFRPGTGNDTINGGAGNDTINFTTGFTAADTIHGGSETDTLSLTGDYSTRVTFTASTMLNVEMISLGTGFSYNLRTNDATVASGARLTVDGSLLGAGQILTFDGSAETDGKFTLKGGAGNDTLMGGIGDDSLNGGAGSNSVTGGRGADAISVTSGSDTLIYTNVNQSTHATFDTLSHFDFLGDDRFDLNVAVTGIDTKIASGTLNTATFDADLATAVGAAQLGAHHAVLFTADVGTAAGLYLVVDANGTAGYQSGADYVFALTNVEHSTSLDVTDFI